MSPAAVRALQLRAARLPPGPALAEWRAARGLGSDAALSGVMGVSVTALKRWLAAPSLGLAGGALSALVIGAAAVAAEKLAALVNERVEERLKRAEAALAAAAGAAPAAPAAPARPQLDAAALREVAGGCFAELELNHVYVPAGAILTAPCGRGAAEALLDAPGREAVAAEAALVGSAGEDAAALAAWLLPQLAGGVPPPAGYVRLTVNVGPELRAALREAEELMRTSMAMARLVAEDEKMAAWEEARAGGGDGSGGDGGDDGGGGPGGDGGPCGEQRGARIAGRDAWGQYIRADGRVDFSCPHPCGTLCATPGAGGAAPLELSPAARECTPYLAAAWASALALAEPPPVAAACGAPPPAGGAARPPRGLAASAAPWEFAREAKRGLAAFLTRGAASTAPQRVTAVYVKPGRDTAAAYATASGVAAVPGAGGAAAPGGVFKAWLVAEVHDAAVARDKAAAAAEAAAAEAAAGLTVGGRKRPRGGGGGEGGGGAAEAARARLPRAAAAATFAAAASERSGADFAATAAKAAVTAAATAAAAPRAPAAAVPLFPAARAAAAGASPAARALGGLFERDAVALCPSGNPFVLFTSTPTLRSEVRNAVEIAGAARGGGARAAAAAAAALAAAPPPTPGPAGLLAFGSAEDGARSVFERIFSALARAPRPEEPTAALDRCVAVAVALVAAAAPPPGGGAAARDVARAAGVAFHSRLIWELLHGALSAGEGALRVAAEAAARAAGESVAALQAWALGALQERLAAPLGGAPGATPPPPTAFFSQARAAVGVCMLAQSRACALQALGVQLSKLNCPGRGGEGAAPGGARFGELVGPRECLRALQALLLAAPTPLRLVVVPGGLP